MAPVLCRRGQGLAVLPLHDFLDGLTVDLHPPVPDGVVIDRLWMPAVVLDNPVTRLRTRHTEILVHVKQRR